ncbi:hypothetical protein QEH38_gp09 [Mycobacterium phage LilSpotty]|uniref:Head-to-tail stopper n=1 Tax=Mycobacterium phage LilSpotty TaxID=2588512 RepID=A0A4Y6EQ36_9CAUD|nr:hypothetical protein QEH38_gp09 [Mycobacterium phage LilSpotty]QDF19741.1 hypothetical protein SEA_LILSPOTTY_9 [Mycobacterium phage LilSpotty]
MTFPTPYTVIHKVFNGVGEDELGNDVESWADGVEVQVIQLAPSMVESVAGYTSRVVADVDMSVPPELVVSVRDRFFLPLPFNNPDDPADKPYEVVALEDYNHGFHQWKPGSVVKLKRVTG